MINDGDVDRKNKNKIKINNKIQVVVENLINKLVID